MRKRIYTDQVPANMAAGTIAVRAELPSTATHITDAQIQEALWNYYYDIEKSVSYLTKKYITKPQAPKKEVVQPAKKTEGKPFSFSVFLSHFIRCWWYSARRDARLRYA